MKLSFSLLTTGILLVAAGAFAQAPPTKQPAAPAKQPAAPAKQPAAAGVAAPTGAPARENGLYAIMKTSMGTITAQLFEKETPGTVRNFVALTKGTRTWKDPKTNTMVAKPLFNNLQFHRVIPRFMIQTGDPTATGGHDCGFTIKDEIVPTLKFDRPGRLGLARLPSPNTGACQFFITEVPYPSLDNQYTLFGQVVEGQDIVSKISGVPRDGNDKPRTPVLLQSVTIQRVGPPPAPAAAPAKKAAAPGAAPTKAPAKAPAPAAPKKQ